MTKVRKKKTWVVGGPACPYRFVFENVTPGIVTLRIFDVDNWQHIDGGAQLLPPFHPNDAVYKAIGFSPDQCRTMVEIFTAALEGA